MKQPTKRCILYARVSTEAQDGEDKTSLESQLEACRALTKREGWDVIAEVRDTSSGGNLNRPGMDRVRAMAKGGDFDVLVCNSQDRMSRMQTDTGILYTEFMKSGVALWTATEGTFDATPTGQFLRQVHAFSAELDRERRREATSRGQRSKVQRGRILGSSTKPTYGYRWVYEVNERGRQTKVGYRVDEAEALVVKRIYTELRQGVSLKAIARGLNFDAIGAPYARMERYSGSGQWGHQTIRSIIQNPFYSGEAWGLVNVRQEAKEGHKRGPVKVDYDHGHKLPEGVVPAIVSRADWDQAQVVLTERQDRGPKPRHPEASMLRSIARCGSCGRAMRIQSRNRSRYLKCTKTGAERLPCPSPSPSIRYDWLAEPVWALVRSLVLEPCKLYDRFHSQEQVEQEVSKLAEHEASLEGIEQRRRTLLRRLEVLTDSEFEELRPRFDELGAERDRLGKEIEVMRRRVQSREGAAHRLSRMLTWAQAEIERVDELSPEEKRSILLELGVVARVYPVSEPERYTIEIGATKPSGNFFDDFDWEHIAEPTPEERRETERLSSEATQRGEESELLAALVDGGRDVSRRYLWDYWDEHVREALAQHGRALAVT